MKQIRCESCHEYVDHATYSADCEQHLKCQPDGQQAEYATLPPEGAKTPRLKASPEFTCIATARRPRKCRRRLSAAI